MSATSAREWLKEPKGEVNVLIATAVYTTACVPTTSSSRKKARSIPKRINIRVDFDKAMVDGNVKFENRRVVGERTGGL